MHNNNSDHEDKLIIKNSIASIKTGKKSSETIFFKNVGILDNIMSPSIMCATLQIRSCCIYYELISKDKIISIFYNFKSMKSVKY